MVNPSIIDDSRDPLAATWLTRVKKANKYYEDWSRKFKCDDLEEYYYGFQWRDGSVAPKHERYMINLVFSTIEVKKPSLLFQNPAFRIKPKPVSGEFDFTASSKRARVREDSLNTVISDEDQEFNEEFEAFIVDAFFRFGVMEVGYSANWIENPNAGKPILKTDNTPYFDPDGEEGGDNTIKEPAEIPQEEKVYFKRIAPWRFRVGGTDGRTFKKCSWVGYYDYYRVEDLKANKNLKNVKELEYAGGRSEDYNEGETKNKDLDSTGDLVKCWTIYDIRAKRKMIFAESNSITLLDKKFKRLPLVSIKFVDKVRGWYPIPLVFNWKSPQDEINDSREQQRLHRKRASRRYLYREGTFNDDEEMQKLEQGPDMTFAKVNGDPSTAVKALENAPLDSAVAQSMLVSRDDFNIISATSAEQRGQSDRTTATQANIIDMKSQLRETAARTKVANVLKKIGRLALLTIQENFTLPFWAKLRTSRFNENFMGEFREAQEEWIEFTSSDMGEEADFEVDISLDTVSPIENEKSKQNFIEFLSVITQFPQIAFDPVLVREAAYRCNYRNEQVIARMAQMAQIAALGQMEMAKQSLMQNMMQDQLNGGGNAAQTRVEQMRAPGNAQIQTQLAGQM